MTPITRAGLGWHRDKPVTRRTSPAILFRHLQAAIAFGADDRRTAGQLDGQVQQSYKALREALQQSRDMRVRLALATERIAKLEMEAKPKPKRKGKK